MPITYRVDHVHRLVIARAQGVITEEDLFAYQRETSSRPDSVGYDGIFDTTGVTRLDPGPPERIDQLAKTAAAGDRTIDRSKSAIIAPDDLAFGLGRMYEAYHQLRSVGKREVAVFRTTAEALAWLGHPGLSLDVPAQNGQA